MVELDSLKSMEISNVIIENRPRLQCANFFITFTNKFSSVDAVKVNVSFEKLSISFDNREFNVNFSTFFQLHTRTLSQLMIKNNYISFRINTNEGSFSSELLHLNESNVANNNFNLIVNAKINTPYVIRCSNCTNSLIDQTKYNRILELPSDNMDMSEWFCHKHHSHGNDEAENGGSTFFDDNCDERKNGLKFKPSNTDIFYGNFFAIFSMTSFKNIRTKGKLVYCKRCFQFLGEITNLKTNDSIRVWNDTITFSDPDTSYDNAKFFFSNDSILKNFIFILRKMRNELSIDPHQIFKVIFETTLSDGKINVLLVQVMDSDLAMLRMMHTNDESGLIVLKKFNTMKLLFKFEEDENQAMVKFWLSNTNISSVQVSPQMFTTAVNNLVKMTTLIPECYRTSCGFSLSYLDI